MSRGLISSTFITILLFFCENLFSQITYTWNLAGGGSWTTASNWTPARNTPATNDILVFNNGGTKTITNVPTQTIGKLQISGNTYIILQATNAGTPTLTVNTAAIDAITVASGSTLQIQGFRSGGTDYSLTLTTANSVGLEANISGTVIVTIETSNRPNTNGIFTKGGDNAIISFNASSIYQHNINGNSIPTSVWNITSTCNITGVTSTAPSGLNQTFGHFTWNCNHSAPINLLGALTTVNGNFTVSRTGVSTGNSGRVSNGLALCTSGIYTLNVGGHMSITNPLGESSWLMLTDGNATATINVAGNFNMSGANNTTFFDFKIGTTTTIGTLTMNITGNFNLAGGYFDWTFQTNGGSNYAVMNLTGNFIQSGSGIMITSTGTTSIPNGRIVFNRPGTQTISIADVTLVVFTNFIVSNGTTVELLSNVNLQSSTNAPWGGQFIVNNGAILDANTYQINSSSGLSVGSNNAFTLNSGAEIITANINGVHQTGLVGPSVSAAIATRTFSSGANYTFDAIAVQNSGTFVTTPTANQVNNLTINNSAGVNTTGVTLQQAFAVAGICTFVNGVFTTTNTNVLTINDNATIVGADFSPGSNKYVNGPLQKIGNDAFVFPVGKQSNGCRWIGISAPSNTTDAFRAELIRGNAGLLGTITAPGLDHVSGCEYWYLDRTSGSSSVNVTLSWNGESSCNAMSYVTDLPNLTVAHFNGTNWDTHGNDGGFTGNAVDGSVTWLNVSTFSPFSLGSLLWWTNPLTVKFINLKATERNGQVRLDWANAQETDVQGYYVEHSIDGINFTSVNNTIARNNNSTLTDYSWWHSTPVAGINYYRIKAVEYSSEVTYSKVVRLNIGKSNNEFTVYPNPVTGNNIGISASGLYSGKYDILILNMTGQRIMHRSLNHSGGALSMQLNLPQNMKAGLYSIKLSGTDQNFVKTFLIQ